MRDQLSQLRYLMASARGSQVATSGYAAYVWVETPAVERKRKYVYGKDREKVQRGGHLHGHGLGTAAISVLLIVGLDDGGRSGAGRPASWRTRRIRLEATALALARSNPVWRGPPRDPPPSVGAVGAIGRFHVLPG